MDILFKQYSELDAKSKILEMEKNDLKLQIMEAMKKEKIDKAETAFGRFSLAIRSAWLYTEKIEKLAEKLKLAKIKEEQQGKAQEKKTEYLIFTSSKL